MTIWTGTSAQRKATRYYYSYRQWITAFSVPKGKFEFVRMPFGLQSCAAYCAAYLNTFARKSIAISVHRKVVIFIFKASVH